LKDVYDDTYQYDIASYQEADRDVISFLKYITNFIFYRFGLEVNKRKNQISICKSRLEFV
jgi:hypothetical protein